ncbi:MAG TPA: histidine kinase dimerization/phospho-acceptor domain-containing protein, partial [Chloroflexota bacterium]|nr:histidine kinase dimerization/phospho-acceptor domain-containing protein [Chloroflexota bacterium]
VDPHGTIRYANPAAEMLLGRGALIGTDFGFPIAGEERTELDLVIPGREPAVVEMRVVPMRWAAEPAYCASLRDVTAQRRAEAQRIQLAREQLARQQAEEALAARDQFLSVAAHELKTPVTRLRLAAQLAARQVAVQQPLSIEMLQRRLANLESETASLVRLVSRLFDEAPTWMDTSAGVARVPDAPAAGTSRVDEASPSASVARPAQESAAS